MILLFETIGLCLLMFLICYLGTGTDEKNIKSFSSYPKELQEKLKYNSKFKNKIKITNPITVFISNFLLFLIILFLLGLPIKSDTYLTNFFNVLIMGLSLNLFDFIVCDILWFRNTKRTRFKDFPDKENYQGIKEHFYSFLRAFIMYILIALLDGLFLYLL